MIGPSRQDAAASRCRADAVAPILYNPRDVPSRRVREAGEVNVVIAVSKLGATPYEISCRSQYQVVVVIPPLAAAW